jgi:RNA polymerase sigma factor (TIGR02999 family)
MNEQPHPPSLALRAADLVALATADPTDLGALDQLVPVVFDELRRIAKRQLRHQHERHTLQTTDLVHEAYLRLLGDGDVTQRGRAYFYAAVARAMRCVLVDAARRRNAVKRGDGIPAVSLDAHEGATDPYADELLDLDVAIRELAGRHARAARVIECRFFGGMSVEDTAEALGVSARTVKSDWALARAWLHDALRCAS